MRTSIVALGAWLAMASLSFLDSLAFAGTPEPNFRRVEASALPEIGMEGDLESFKTALKRQIERCSTQDLKARFQFADRVVTRKQWCIDTNREFLRMAEGATTFADVIRAARDRFEWFQSKGRNGAGEVMFTGYHSPTLEASATPTSTLQVPLYRQPDDLVQVIEGGKKKWRRKNPDGTFSPYWTREEIDLGGALQGRGLELAYATDWLTAFLLQTEGSGVLLMRTPGGKEERRFFNYAAQNGHPYASIGQYLREQGVPEEFLTVPGLKRYFRENPEKLRPTLAKNPSYVFFRFDREGPFGVDSLLLSPRHSIAIDLAVFPVGAVTLFQTERPEMKGEEVESWKRFTTLAVTQDTGGAIKGPGRVDIFWGEDAYAAEASGRMHHLGSIFVALPKESPKPPVVTAASARPRN